MTITGAVASSPCTAQRPQAAAVRLPTTNALHRPADAADAAARATAPRAVRRGAKGAFVGALVGGVAGVVVGTATCGRCDEPSPVYYATAIFTLVGAVVGLVIGAVS